MLDLLIKHFSLFFDKQTPAAALRVAARAQEFSHTHRPAPSPPLKVKGITWEFDMFVGQIAVPFIR